MADWPFASFYERILIPAEVQHEVTEVGRGLPGAEEVRNANWIEAVPQKFPADPSLAQGCQSLGAGERGAIVLAKSLKPIQFCWMSGKPVVSRGKALPAGSTGKETPRSASPSSSPIEMATTVSTAYSQLKLNLALEVNEGSSFGLGENILKALQQAKGNIYRPDGAAATILMSRMKKMNRMFQPLGERNHSNY